MKPQHKTGDKSSLALILEEGKREFDKKFLKKLPDGIVSTCLCGKHHVGQILMCEPHDIDVMREELAATIIAAIREKCVPRDAQMTLDEINNGFALKSRLLSNLATFEGNQNTV